jgi:CRP/FNR family transcriptional regulator
MNSSNKRTAAPCLDDNSPLRAQCEGCSIYNVALLQQLIDRSALDDALRPIDDLALVRGDVVYQERDSEDAIYTIRRGLVKAVQYLPDGAQRIVRLYNQGNALGVERLLNLPYEHTLIATGPVNLCRIPLNVIRDLNKQTPQLYEELIEHWHSHVRQADTWITQFSTGSVRARVARFILYLAELEGEVPEDNVELLHGEEMAAVLGVTPESVSRVMAELKRNGTLALISQTPREIHQFNRAALESLAFGS